VSDVKAFTKASHQELCTLVESRVESGESVEDIAAELNMRPRTLASMMFTWRKQEE
jgi:competence protein ComGF